ncbi:methyltransferase [Spiroplasma gladiatoris]|uniref:Methyltransferase n=1 Tax=Spiroplasma gladiatoris TaxID=2143 RepID=A0A4P7AI79_9MOLU|nr:class I SAM-dependent methyltransferase [Spiroplasma gladiatoris]QBQ07881.1 methyltransferase [Spiroplasma gladiatoris]
MNNKYENYSSVLYDFTKPPGTSIDGDLEFYKNLLMPIEGKVLEAGVGNGRLLIPFLKYKIDIEGIDKSKSMLEICNKNLAINDLECTLIDQDLEHFIKPEYYEFIIMPNASFCLLENRQIALKVLHNFFISLKSKGSIAIDLILPIEFKKGSSHSMEHHLPNLNLNVKNYNQEIDWFYQYTINKIEYYDRQTLLETQLVKLSWYGVEEFKSMLEKIGFKEVYVIKNYNNNKLINLKTITFIAKKD